MDKTLIGCAMTDAREALLMCQTAREELAAGNEMDAVIVATSALDYAMSAAQWLAQALGNDALATLLSKTRHERED